MVMIYSLLGHRAACWAGINQRVLHHWVRGLPAQDPAVGAPTYQLQKAGVVLVISEPPIPVLLYWGATSAGLFLGLFIPGSSLPGFLSPNLCQVPCTAALTFSRTETCLWRETGGSGEHTAAPGRGW